MSPKKYTSELAKFIIANSEGVSLGVIANGIGISKSYLSEIINERKDPSVEVLNKISNYFNVPIIHIYKLMGWINNDPDGELSEYINELVKRDPDFIELVKTYATIETPEERRRAIRVIKSLLEGND